MEPRAALMESYGMEVIRLYHPDATWENIRDNLSGASIVIYSGHGFGYDPGDPNYLTTGGGNNGFCITDPNNLSGATLATQNMLIAYSQLARDAVVIMAGACYSAGSAGWDVGVVPEEVARRRVNDYSYTFLTIGAGAYFAGGSPDYYLEQILSNPEGDMDWNYKSTPSFNPTSLRDFDHMQYPFYYLWLDPMVDPQGAVLGWNSAFAGNPALTGGQVFSTCIFGDFDCDGDVDAVDIMMVASRWRCKCREECYDPHFDIDKDCDIDIVDIMKVVAHWG